MKMMGKFMIVLMIFMLTNSLIGATPEPSASNHKLTACEKLKALEGFAAKSYKDVGGVETIGYGETGKTVNGSITKATAAQLLKRRIAKIDALISLKVKTRLSASQKVALISLIYNIGETAFVKSSLLKAINNGADLRLISQEFMKWTYVHGKKVKGLQIRRQTELALWKESYRPNS